MEKIYCETHQCQIAVHGCLARQARAKEGLIGGKKRHDIYFPGSGKTHIRSIPYDSKCLDCEQGKTVSGEAKAPKPKRPKLYAPPGFKVCRKHLGDPLPLGDFPVNARMSDGHGSWCKVCNNAHAKAAHARKKAEREAAHA